MSQAKNEATVQDLIRRDSAETYNGLLMRNNVGVLKDANNRPIRFGLANDSARMNKVCKSSDLIGITPITITPEMVGKTIGVFTGIEVKKEGWVYRPNDKHIAAQHKFHALVQSSGGIAGFARSVVEYRAIIYNFYQQLIKP